MKYMTDDGKTFDDQKDAMAHENLLAARKNRAAEVEGWVRGKFPTYTDATVTRTVNIILQWETRPQDDAQGIEPDPEFATPAFGDSPAASLPTKVA